jgi:hypothetical protein
MDEGIRRDITQRMTELRYESWSEQSIIVDVVKGATERIKAFNENYFLFDISDVEVPFSVRADNESITDRDYIVTGSPVVCPEFTGNLTIKNLSSTTDLRFVFIQCIPDFE